MIHARHRTVSPLIGLALGLVLPLGLAGIAPAQQPGATTQASPAKAAHEQQLDAVRAEQRKAAEAEALLKGEIAALGEDRRKLNEALIGTAARLRVVEGHIVAAEARLKK